MAKGPDLCERFHQAIELIGRRWSGAIIALLLREPLRFGVLRDAIPGITDRMLSERLRELERELIVTRTVVPDIPVHVVYSLTTKGRSLADVMNAVAGWAHEWIPEEATPARRRISSPSTRTRQRAVSAAAARRSRAPRR